MEQSIILTNEFLFLYYHFSDIKRFFENGMLEEFSELRCLVPHEYRNTYCIYHQYDKQQYPNEYEQVTINGKNVILKKIDDAPNTKFEIKPLDYFQWKETYTDTEIYNAVSIFFKVVNFINSQRKDDSISKVIQESLEIANYKKMAINKFAIFSTAETIIDAIAQTMDMDIIFNKNDEFNTKLNKIADLIAPYSYYNYNNKNTKNNFDLYRSFRNTECHDIITGEQRKAVTYSLYLLIWTVYKLYKRLIEGKPNTSNNNLKNSKSSKEKLIEYLSGFEEDAKKEHDKCILKCKVNGEQKYLIPFNKLGTNIILNLTHQEAEFQETNTGEYTTTRKNYQLAPRITSEDLAKQLKGKNEEQLKKVIALLNDSNNNISEYLQDFKTEILEKLKEGNVNLPEWANKIDALIPAINTKIDEQTEALKEHVSNKTDEQTEALKEHVSNKTDEQTEVLKEHVSNKTDEQTEALKEHVSNKTDEQTEALKEHVSNKTDEQTEALKEHVSNKTDEQTEALKEHVSNKTDEQTEVLKEHVSNKTDEQTEALKEHVSNKTDEQTETLNESTKKIINESLEIKEIKDEIKRIVEEIGNTIKESKESISQKYLKDIDSLYHKLEEIADNNKNTKTLKNAQECINEARRLKKEICKKIEDAKELTTKEKKRKKYIKVISICTIIIILVGLILWKRSDHPYTQRIIGNPDAEYEYASNLEREGHLKEAAEWYKKAINHYETFVYEKEDSFDLRISPLLTKLYLQNKGGVHNPQKALSFINRGIDYVERREVIGVYMYWQCLYGDRDTLKEKLVWAKNAIPDIFESPNYAALSKAYFELTEPNLPEEKYTAAVLMLNRCINSGIWREANYVGSLLYREGIKGTWGLKHSLYRTHKLLEKAADGNFIMAQLALGDRLKYLRQIEKAFKYYNLAYSNGFDDHLPLLKELAKELKHFNLLDSLNKLGPKGDLFYRNVMSYDKRRLPEERLKILETSIKHFDSSKHRMNFSRLKRTYIHDYLESDKDLDSLIYHPDTLSMKEYLLGTKHALGYGKVKKNQTKADSLIQIAVKKGYVDAIYTWGRLLYERGNTLGAIKEFRKISNIDQRAVEYLTFMYQKIDKTRSLRYESILKEPTKMYRPNLFTSDITSINEYTEKVEELENFLCSNEYIDSRNIAVYAGMLSNLYLNSGAEEEVVNFYREIACNGLLNEKGFYMLYSHSIFLYLSGKIELAKDCFINFCINYFKLNGNNGDKSEREQIVNVLWHYFPELEKNIKEILGFDFTNGINRKEGQSIIDVSALDIDLYPNEPIYKY